MYIYICPTQFMNSQLYNFTDIQYICRDLWILSPGALAVMATGTPRANPPLGSTSAGRWRDISEHQDEQGNPCCPVALQWGKACWRKTGDRHKKMSNLQRVGWMAPPAWVSNLAPAESCGQGVAGVRSHQYVVEVKPSTQAPQERLLHDGSLSWINLVPQH